VRQFLRHLVAALASKILHFWKEEKRELAEAVAFWFGSAGFGAHFTEGSERVKPEFYEIWSALLPHRPHSATRQVAFHQSKRALRGLWPEQLALNTIENTQHCRKPMRSSFTKLAFTREHRTVKSEFPDLSRAWYCAKLTLSLILRSCLVLFYRFCGF